MPGGKIVAVSRLGFTDGAMKKAADQSIECLTLEQAQGHHWLEQIGSSVELRGRTFTIESYTLLINKADAGLEPTIEMDSGFVFIPGGLSISALTLLESAHKDPAIVLKVHELLMAADVLGLV